MSLVQSFLDSSSGSSNFNPNLSSFEWKETPEVHIFKVDVPGFKKEEVKRSTSDFLMRLRLPENAKLNQVKVSMENGVLTVTVPKKEVKKLDVKAIDISG
ncbi:hypothetical protein JCGZ_02899 [Jatropha curcas]|uniref:SHSP domain-containing protein n=1 Tax=Jatropha curcas TaxID=180498 RepID=A0A067LDL4_JATCU|nr:hypothetical protein JCGZ_02899 [Jatropha curcas]